MFSKQAKMSLNIWATLVRKFVTKNIQKSHNLVTLQSHDISALTGSEMSVAELSPNHRK